MSIARGAELRTLKKPMNIALNLDAPTLLLGAVARVSIVPCCEATGSCNHSWEWGALEAPKHLRANHRWRPTKYLHSARLAVLFRQSANMQMDLYHFFFCVRTIVLMYFKLFLTCLVTLFTYCRKPPVATPDESF